MEEIHRQQREIKRFLVGKDFSRVIDASQGVDETVRRVSAEIEKWFTRKVV